MSVSKKVLGGEPRWLMGRVMAGDFLEGVSGLRAERTSLLSFGDDQCRFAVPETDDPFAGYTDKIEQRFITKPESG